jgi:hypothetical protein
MTELDHRRPAHSGRRAAQDHPRFPDASAATNVGIQGIIAPTANDVAP